ncbi:polysaccharide deacetylase family protein [Ferviditalea candida]|uniref:Polysaccharide deacetylase family protein n=1 Tax=Ferviditalea candida TaxID=3108399 RepID=A0ABU5ZJZ4_9BACL|nr:polysaccharide deacetylase family protein [Paenibacillaceae bacterium T2]
MKKNALILLLLSLSVILAACQTKQPPNPSAPKAQSAAASPAVQPAASPPTVPAPTPATSPMPMPSPVSAETKPAPAPVSSAKPAYYMNSSYFIKPLDEKGNRKVVLLTFDDGPKKKEMVDQMLDVLDKHHAKAIFFVNGYRVKENPELLKEIHDRGQTIGNHSWDHIDLSKLPKEKIEQQIGDVQSIVKQLTGETPVFFRPPFGTGKGFVKEVAKEHHLLFMTWSNGSLDWADNKENPQGVIQSVLDQLNPGSNILMHELPWTVQALDELLSKLEQKEYGFVDPKAIEIKLDK